MGKLQKNNRMKSLNAFEEVEQIQREDFQGKFKGHIKNIPMYIYTNGLISTLAFVLKKAENNKEENSKEENKKKESSEKKSYSRICKMIVDYLNDYEKIENEQKTLLKKIVELSLSPSEYRKVSLRLIDYLEEVVEFSEAMLKGEDKIHNENTKGDQNG